MSSADGSARDHACSFKLCVRIYTYQQMNTQTHLYHPQTHTTYHVLTHLHPPISYHTWILPCPLSSVSYQMSLYITYDIAYSSFTSYNTVYLLRRSLRLSVVLLLSSDIDMWGHGWIQMCGDMGGCRCARTWEDTDMWGYGRIQMCEDMGGYRCVRTWEDADVWGHGRI